ncbi:MAG: hypothetical protein ACHP85_09920 [Burkholderiales bacterium]|jgi:hypothetical protein
MRSTPLAVLLAAHAAAQTPAPITRSVTLSVYTKKAEPVSDLRPDEVVVSEGGRKPTVLGLEPDRRPLEVAVVVDSSAAAASSYRSDLVAAVMALWKALPPDASIAVWTSGPPSRVVDFGTPLAEAEPRLQSVAPAGKNYAFDAILDASRALGRRPSERRAIVYVGGIDIEASATRVAETQQALGQALAVPLMVLIQPGGAGAALGGPTSGIATSWDVQGYVEKMTPSYGGTSWVVLSTQAAANTLREAAAILSSQYRVRYESTAEALAAPKVEVRRKGVKTLAGRTQLEVAKGY